MDFPENSLSAFNQASLISSVRTLETDVQVSADGELFLLHDPHLSRTASIRTACTHLDPLHAASQLSYYTGSCPLATVPLKQDSHQRLPLFREYLEVAVANNMNVLFDLYRPVSGHNREHQHVAMTIDALLESKLDLSKVWIHTYRCQHSECFILKVWWLSPEETSLKEHAVPARLSGVMRVGVTKQTDPDQFQYRYFMMVLRWTENYEVFEGLRTLHLLLLFITVVLAAVVWGEKTRTCLPCIVISQVHLFTSLE